MNSYVSSIKFGREEYDYLKKGVLKPIQLEYIADDQIGLEKIKKLISNNLFKPLINKQLLTHQGAIPKSILLHGPESTGKLTMVKYIATQLNWNVLPYD